MRKGVQVTNDMLSAVESTKQMLTMYEDDYHVGMYNGIEYVLSTLEKRKPKYFVLVGGKETEEPEQRTVGSGVKRR